MVLYYGIMLPIPHLNKWKPIILVDIGLPYTGKAPDLGAFEAQSGSTPAGPVYTSSAVANATPSILEMTYNLTLANIVPAASAFSVLVNSAARSVSTVAISGTKVQLTLSTRILPGDVVKLFPYPNDGHFSIEFINPLQSEKSLNPYLC